MTTDTDSGPDLLPGARRIAAFLGALTTSSSGVVFQFFAGQDRLRRSKLIAALEELEAEASAG